MTWLLLPMASFASMFCQDILCVFMVRAEAQGRAHAAGLWDMAQDACRLTATMIIGDTVLIGRNVPLSAAVVGATLAADYWGTRAGVQLSTGLERRADGPGRSRTTADGSDRLWAG